MKANVVWIAAVVLLSLGFAAGFRVEAWRWDSAEAAQLVADAKAQKDAQDAANKKAVAWEKERADILDANKKLSRKLAYEISSNHVYSDCIVPSAGVLALTEAVSGVSPAESGK